MADRAKSYTGWSPRHWTTLRKIAQYTALILFIVLFVWSRRGGLPPELVSLPMQLDPLAMLAHLLASRTVLITSAWALLTIALTIIFGRAWCGWLCPMGTVLQVFSLDRWRGKHKAPPDSWRKTKYGLLLIILAAALFANLTLLVFDPLTILLRTLSVSVWPAVDQVVRAAETALYHLPVLRPAVSWFDGIVRPKVLPPDPAFYRDTALYASVFAGIIALNLLASRSWCRYLCPLGALLGLLSKIGIVRREVNARCQKCDKCVPVCPTGTVAQKDYSSDPAECTMCLECLKACPFNAIQFPSHRTAAKRQSYDPGRRQAIFALGAAAVGISLLRSDRYASRETIPSLSSRRERGRTTSFPGASAAGNACVPAQQVLSNPL